MFDSTALDHGGLREEAEALPAYAELRQSLKKVEVDGEVLYLVESDVLLDEDQLKLFVLQRESEERARRDAPVPIEPDTIRLVGMERNGQPVRWRPGKRLSFCVLRRTFPTEAHYEAVLEATLEATREWENTCGVHFDYVSDVDLSNDKSPGEVLFPVRYFDSGGKFVAAGFFPTDPKKRRRLLIDPTWFTTTFDRVGVLRHELGHVLGFRHEHIRSGAPPECPDENQTGTFDLTEYDPQSVMHYLCGQVGSKELKITALDRIGSRKLYGPPLSDFRAVE